MVGGAYDGNPRLWSLHILASLVAKYMCDHTSVAFCVCVCKMVKSVQSANMQFCFILGIITSQTREIFIRAYGADSVINKIFFVIVLFFEMEWMVLFEFLRFQVLTAASVKFRIVFWDVLPCKIIVDRRFRGTCGWFIPDDGGSTYLWNIGLQLFYTAVHPRRQFWTSLNLFLEVKRFI
jgi:hypothetical protein